jgi:citrate synthase
MPKTATLKIDDKELSLPIIIGTENERAVDISKLRAETGYITFDDGFANTGSAQSNITYIDGEQGILRYRGYPIEQLAEKSNFIETAYLVIHGELPTPEQRTHFSSLLTQHAPLHQQPALQRVKKYSTSWPSTPPSALTSALPLPSSHKRKNDSTSLPSTPPSWLKSPTHWQVAAAVPGAAYWT